MEKKICRHCLEAVTEDHFCSTTGRMVYFKGGEFISPEEAETLKAIKQIPRQCKHCGRKFTDDHRCYRAERTVYFDDDNDFFLSFVAGYTTGNPFMGAVIGGNLPGSMLGAELNDSGHSHNDHHHGSGCADAAASSHADRDTHHQTHESGTSGNSYGDTDSGSGSGGCDNSGSSDSGGGGGD